jgi:hypothetical protein
MRAMRDQVEAMVMKTGNCEESYHNDDYEDDYDYYDDDFQETSSEYT